MSNPNQPQAWNDFNSADSQQQFELIPADTVAPVCMRIKPGGYDDPTQNWTGGYAKQNQETGSIYLDCEFVILAGEFAKRKLWNLIGLHSPKGPTWQNMGRSFIRGLLNSAYGLSDKDDSPQAQQKRRIQQLSELDLICFVAKITAKKDTQGNMRNQIAYALTPDNADYQTYAAYLAQQPMAMGATTSAPPVATAPTQNQGAPVTNSQSTGPLVPPNRPKWAQPEGA